MGCRRTAERVPDPRPATKWYALKRCQLYMRGTWLVRIPYSTWTWTWPWEGHRCSSRSLSFDAIRVRKLQRRGRVIQHRRLGLNCCCW